ncbi:hypothetical protein FVE85_7094 [Porphyridium purpureum]|uniref:Uncharacterized protein n=1 Tax=Porphyridium purpureum TaxID=35688 RepID=A0A5J4Z640_PORPP|nr:hypothetical protein FVE85_7094 [Porphyridium purpureum]|eukprot:POR1008..scf295_1
MRYISSSTYTYSSKSASHKRQAGQACAPCKVKGCLSDGETATHSDTDSNAMSALRHTARLLSGRRIILASMMRSSFDRQPCEATAARGAALLVGSNVAHRAGFASSAGAGAGSPRVQDLCARAREQLETLYKADWTTVEDEDVEGLDKILESFRFVLANDDASSEQTEVMAETYAARHASVITAHYAEFVRWTMRMNLYSTGWLGEARPPKEQLLADATSALEDYPKFIDSIGSDRVRKKVAHELGIKIIQLRQTLQLPEYSTKFPSMATDHVVTREY